MTAAEEKRIRQLQETNVFDTFNFYHVPDLTEAERKPPEFIVQNMLPVGMSFLSGSPKTRKSFLALQMAIAVATGTPFFGLKTKQCEVAYFDLEGSKSRISSRTEHMSIAIPKNVHITNKITEKISDGLVDRLQILHQQRPEIKFMILDTYARAKGRIRTFGANAYEVDCDFLEPVQQMAMEEQISLLFVHHDKKGAGFATDSFERLSGTMGISGSSDAVLNLITEGKRFEGKATLEYTPRDARGGELNLVFNDRCLEWMEAPTEKISLEGNAVCSWILQNCPGRQKEGVFFAYEDIFTQAYHSYSPTPGDKIREQVEANRDSLFSDYGIGVQLGVQSHGRRGIRVINLQ